MEGLTDQAARKEPLKPAMRIPMVRGQKTDTLGGMKDTSPEMQRRYYAHLGKMSSAERVARLVALTKAITDLAIAGIKRGVPDATPRMLTAHLANRRYGRAVAERFFPDIFPPSE